MAENNNEKRAAKERGKVFSPREVELLISLIRANANVVENKKSDSQTWRDKEEAWKKLTNEFNAVGLGVPRTATQLQNKYNILKRNSRKEFANLKCSFNKTGGGEYKPPKLSDVSIKINEICSLSISGDTNEADCDAPEDCVIPLPVTEPIVIVVPPPSDIGTCSTSTSSEHPQDHVELWSNYSPALLRKPKHKALISSRNVSSQLARKKPRVDSFMEEKLELIETQKNYFKNLNSKLEEEHSFKMQCMREEHEWKKRHAEEEHELKIKKLK